MKLNDKIKIYSVLNTFPTVNTEEIDNNNIISLIPLQTVFTF